jgi:aspartate aminotransferase
MDTIQSQSTSNASSISQAAAIAALRSERGFMPAWLDELKARRDEATAILNTAPQLRCVASEGAFYLFVNCAGAIGKRTPDGRVIASDSALANYLVDSVGVGTVSGEAFGASPFLRVAYAVPRVILREACLLITQACNALS